MIDEVVAEFLLESAGNLDQLDADLHELEHAPHDRKRLASVFRTIHTIKGTCGFLGFARLEAVSHAGEGLLVKVRDGAIVFDHRVAALLLDLGDIIRYILAAIDATGREPNEDCSDIIADLAALAEGRPEGDARASRPQRTLPRERRRTDRRGVGERRLPVARERRRVETEVLHRLATLVDELALTKEVLMRLGDGRPEGELARAARRLSTITSDLQAVVACTRRQPIGRFWEHLPRFVNDLAAQAGKQVELDIEGRELEVDNAIADAIKDPLLHAVRNAVAHGIEEPERRARGGKATAGRIRLRAVRVQDEVLIEVSDDGAGIDVGQVRTVAVACGIVAADAAARLNDGEVVRLVFHPGFTTAREVTPLSGRGVGMDVIRTNVEGIGGQVEVLTVVGQGTTLRIRVPAAVESKTPRAVPLVPEPQLTRSSRS